MAHAPPSITDHITDQNTPYCDELGDAVYNENRVLAVTWCRYREPSPCGGTTIYHKDIIYQRINYL